MYTFPSGDPGTLSKADCGNFQLHIWSFFPFLNILMVKIQSHHSPVSLEGKLLVKDTTQKLKRVCEVERLVANGDSA